ncbi:MAG: VanW family protein [Defluviitaleaceae bacterium]|nr:VanW family protein [Defluviitaleaceae bacterium]
MLTKRFPFLLPIRRFQRKLFFYIGMWLDHRRYARGMSLTALPHTVFLASSELYNQNTGFDMIYQENKVHNLRVLAKSLRGLTIKPGETFSFWQAARRADRHEPYRDGLVLKDGELTVARAGGLCQMSNLLFWMFLHSPLTIVERHSHRVKNFATPEGMPEGVDAAISEGWLDLKLTNETDIAFQIDIEFSETHITGILYADKELATAYEIQSRDVTYFEQEGTTHQQAYVYRNDILLYKNTCIMGVK